MIGRYFKLTRAEQRSFVLVTCVITVVVLLKFLNKQSDERTSFIQKAKVDWTTGVNEEKTRKPVETHAADIGKEKRSSQREAKVPNANDHKLIPSTSKKKVLQIPSESFDPNECTLEDWEKMGFSQSKAKVIYSFIHSGKGGIVDANELSKIYVLSSYEKEQILTKARVSKTDLNVCTSQDLIRFNGVGEVIASRIIKYRDLLGGFHSSSQLQEVYGLDESMVEKMVPYVACSKTEKIQINSASLFELKKHPYISYEEAKLIVGERAKGVSVDKIVEQLSNKTKLLPYLDL